MKNQKLLLAAALVAILPAVARADVTLQNMLSGTGDNVVFDTLNGHVAVGSFNGQHTGIVDFTDLSNNSLFTGAANGNDIKIADTSDLKIQVFTSNGLTVLPTLTDVFSLKGTGDVTATVTANESGGGTKTFTFDLGMIDPNAQSGFTLTATNGETINQYTLLDTGGLIADFEHYRIDVAGPSVVPGPVMGGGIPAFVGSAVLFALLRRRRESHATHS